MTLTRSRCRATALAAVGLALAGTSLLACSSDAADTSASAKPSTSTSPSKGTEVRSNPAAVKGPAAALAPLTGGDGVRLLAAEPGPDLKAVGYEEEEYRASGRAISYSSAGDLPADGRFELSPDQEADFATRVVVRRPADPADANGTVVVEWLNVSSGADAGPDYTYLADEIVREGTTWVGVSAQRIGVEGGDVAVSTPLDERSGAGKGLRALDPARYDSLHHPGDAFSYDIYTQVARALRAHGTLDPLEGLQVDRMLAIGESQSAFALTTYANGVQPLTHEFDGFLIHSRGGAAAPLGRPDEGIDIAGTISGAPTRIRTDVGVPTIMVETETDVLGLLGYYPARQPDGDHIRLWEVAGTAHADLDQVGPAATQLGCLAPINDGQQGYVLRAALHHLDRWTRGGAKPPSAPRLDVDDTATPPVFEVDENGNVTGGIRTPAVDAPVAVLSGMPVEDSSIVCLLMGSTTPLASARLAELYPDAGDRGQAYEKAADRAIAAGFILAADRDALIDDARSSG